ncbi:MAG: ATP-binding cassette domain-containing protein, partial [Solirubrobacterales bacterium]
MEQSQSKVEASGSDSGSQPLLALKGYSKSFGAVEALKDVDLDVYGGEVLGLVGDNGAGKTTLVKCLSGVHRPDSGSILVDGRDASGLTTESARTLGIETVYQNLSLVDTLDVMQNWFLNRELVYGNPLGRALGLMNKRRMYRET